MAVGVVHLLEVIDIDENQRQRSPAQMANAIGSTIWKLAANVVLNMENENFETATQAQRVDIMEEAVCYLVHFCDRWVYPKANQGQRVDFIHPQPFEGRHNRVGPGKSRVDEMSDVPIIRMFTPLLREVHTGPL